MKMKMISLLAVILSIESIQAQDTLKLELQDALTATLKNNKEIFLAKIDEEIATVKFSQSNAVFLPQIGLNYTAVATNNPLNAFGFKLQQQSVVLTDFSPALLNNPSVTRNYLTQIEWKQPLLNLDLIYQRRAAEKQIDLYDYKTQRIQEYLTFEVQKAYAQLQLAHQEVLVLKESLSTINSIYTTSKIYYEKGLLQKSDLLSIQVQVASTESKSAEAINHIRNASDYLSLLMDDKSGNIYRTDSLQKYNAIESIMEQVPGNRADFKALESALKAQQMVAHAEKLSRLPKLNAFATYMINDNTAFGFGSNSYVIGAQFSWNLFTGTASFYRTAEQKLKQSRIEQQLHYEKEQSQVEVNKTLRGLEVAQFKLHQHETSVKQASEAFRILQNRFQQGLISINDLLQAQSTVSQQKLLLGEAIFNYNTTLAYLKFLTSTDEPNDQ